MSEEQATIAVPAEPEPSLQEYREERASAGTSPYRTSNAQMPPLPPGELAKRREAKASERRQELQAIRAEAEKKLRELEGGRYGVSEQAAQPPAQPAQHEGVDASPVRSQEPEKQPEAPATKPEAQQPQIPANLSEADRAFHEQHYAKHANLATRLKETIANDAEFAAASKACEKVNIPLAAQIALVESPNAHDVAVHLTKNVHTVEKLTERYTDLGDTVYALTGDVNLARAYADQWAIGEVQRISAGLEYGNGGRSRSQVVQKPVSQAPEPIKPVGGTSGPAFGDSAWEDLPMSELRKLRESGRLR